MTLSIAEQIETNRNLLLSLPYYCNFAEVWNPDTLRHELSCVFETTDRGTEILRAS